MSFWCAKISPKYNNELLSNHVGADVPVRPNEQKHTTKLMSNTAITLIALVITIIVLLILAGVALNMVIGENGIFNKANNAKEETLRNEAREAVELSLLSARAEYTISPEGMNLKSYVENENNKIEVTNIGDGTVLDYWTFTYKDEYEFEIYDLEIQSEGLSSADMRLTSTIEGYAFKSTTGEKVTITLNIERLNNSLNGQPITVNVTPSQIEGTLTGNTYKLEFETDGSTNYNDDYEFEVTIGTATASKTVTLDRILEDPELEVTDITDESFKINIKNNYPVGTGITYKYYVTKTSDSSNIYTSSNYETTNPKDITNGIEEETEYLIETEVYLNGVCKEYTDTIETLLSGPVYYYYNAGTENVNFGTNYQKNKSFANKEETYLYGGVTDKSNSACGVGNFIISEPDLTNIKNIYVHFYDVVMTTSNLSINAFICDSSGNVLEGEFVEGVTMNGGDFTLKLNISNLNTTDMQVTLAFGANSFVWEGQNATWYNNKGTGNVEYKVDKVYYTTKQ